MNKGAIEFNDNGFSIEFEIPYPKTYKLPFKHSHSGWIFYKAWNKSVHDKWSLRAYRTAINAIVETMQDWLRIIDKYIEQDEKL